MESFQYEGTIFNPHHNLHTIDLNSTYNFQKQFRINCYTLNLNQVSVDQNKFTPTCGLNRGARRSQ